MRLTLEIKEMELWIMKYNNKSWSTVPISLISMGHRLTNLSFFFYVSSVNLCPPLPIDVSQPSIISVFYTLGWDSSMGRGMAGQV